MSNSPAPAVNRLRPILLVDDNEDDRFLLRIAYQRAGLDSPLTELPDGAAAIDYLAHCGSASTSDREPSPLPAAVFLDLHMPRMNGFEVLDWISGRSELKQLPVIILSASSRRADILRAKELGRPHAYLVKPTSLDELVGLMKCFREWQQRNELFSEE